MHRKKIYSQKTLGVIRNPADKGGLTPLHIAAKRGHLDICEIILKNMDNKNKNPEAPLHHGNTPLHFAAKNGNLDVYNLIIKYTKGLININPKNSEGKTPLNLACEKGHHHILNFSVKPEDKEDKMSAQPSKKLNYRTGEFF